MLFISIHNIQKQEGIFSLLDFFLDFFLFVGHNIALVER